MRLPRLLARALRPVSRGLVAALALLLLALALPRWNLPQDSWDTVVVFDITQSMNVEDYELDGRNVSRLDFARAAARRALRELPCGSRVGWAAFAEYRTLLLVSPVEVCEHYGDLVAALDNIDGRMRWGNASEIAKGVYWAVRTARAEASHPDIVFLTDGHEAPPVKGNGPAPFDDARGGEIHGWILGVGGDAARPIPRTDDDGQRIGFWRAEDVIQMEADPGAAPGSASAEQLSGLHEPHLRFLARQVGFDYARLDTAGALARAIADPRLARRVQVPTDLSWLPAGAALALLLVRLWPYGAPPWRQWLARLRNGRGALNAPA